MRASYFLVCGPLKLPNDVMEVEVNCLGQGLLGRNQKKVPLVGFMYIQKPGFSPFLLCVCVIFGATPNSIQKEMKVPKGRTFLYRYLMISARSMYKMIIRCLDRHTYPTWYRLLISKEREVIWSISSGQSLLLVDVGCNWVNCNPTRDWFTSHHFNVPVKQPVFTETSQEIFPKTVSGFFCIGIGADAKSVYYI